ncbi:HNH endonuclease [Sphingomonas sp. KR1UV-12]|uniref:HNH endonuclease n=1 Tax=Sphingomonas aurea TaxID=3063994 RepID=A0ABT9EHC2_9SPHN|nr:HNH endonuclease [Sphingomonas sp. KR1UV-12]MDP1026365.1 HNH endonuclease [Sphingomonas sp. KR1UV-12]
MAWLEAHRDMVIGDYHRAFVTAFHRTDIAAKHLHSLRNRRGWLTGRTGRFEKGQVPANKGTRCKPGKGGLHPNAQRTQFRKGGRTGKAALNYKPIGTERVSKDGYRERKVHDGLPMRSRWQLVQRLEWEAVNGPVPAGYALKCLDGDRLNTNPGNWEALPRGVLARLNGGRFRRTLPYDEASPEVKPTVMAVAKLKHRTAERQRSA